jgi:hypothetical protein
VVVELDFIVAQMVAVVAMATTVADTTVALRQAL